MAMGGEGNAPSPLDLNSVDLPAGVLLELARQQNQKRPVATVIPIARARRRRSSSKEPSKRD
jgi:hypothetical protein